MNLLSADIFEVPRRVIAQTEQALRRAGSQGYEVFVLWSGRLRSPRFEVLDAHVPRQTSYRTSQGLLVRVEGDALHQLNKWLYENKQILAVQVHAHPNHDASHSITDDTYPIVSTAGSLSIVAPNFCRGPLIGPMTRGYRLDRDGWSPFPVAALLRTVAP